MSFKSIGALVAACLFGGLVCGCAARPPVPDPPAEAHAPPPADGRAQLLRALDALKRQGGSAEEENRNAASVLDALGVTVMQGDGGVTSE